MNGSPVWAINPVAARLIESGALDAVARAAERVKYEPRDRVELVGDMAIIPLMGVLVRHEGLWTQYGFGTSTLSAARKVNAAANNPKVRSIVLVVDSPGGEVGAIYPLAEAVRNAAAQKNIIAQIDGQAASGAYWIASQAEKVFASPGDVVGGVGVRILLFDYSRAYELEGIKAIAVDSGEFKSLGAPGTKITARHRQYLQSQIDYYGNDFFKAVAIGRRFTPTALQRVSDGREHVARAALGLHLIDGIQTLSQTLGQARRDTAQQSTLHARQRWREVQSLRN